MIANQLPDDIVIAAVPRCKLDCRACCSMSANFGAENFSTEKNEPNFHKATNSLSAIVISVSVGVPHSLSASPPVDIDSSDGSRTMAVVMVSAP